MYARHKVIDFRMLFSRADLTELLYLGPYTPSALLKANLPELRLPHRKPMNPVQIQLDT